MRDDAHRALVADHLALDLLAVGIAIALDAQGDDAALVDGVASERLEAAVGGGHRRSVAYGAGRRVHAAAASARTCASIVAETAASQ